MAINDNYSFLNDYLNKIGDDSEKIDPNTQMEDDNDFFDTKDDQPEVDDGIEYGISNDNQDNGYDTSQEQKQDDDANVLDYLLGDNDPYSMDGETNDDSYDMGVPLGGDNPSIASKISKNESQGKYTAFNPKGGGSGAVGKYQFRWNIWKDSIQKVTGVKSSEEFRHSPKAQEKYFSWYEKHYLKPAADKLKPYNKMNLDEDQLEQLVHFRGEGGAKKYLLGKAKDKPESYNMSTSKYISKHQMGGVPVAMNAGQQFTGLNDSSFSEMMFPMSGVNTFRGLDSGEPIYLEDEEGKKKVLKGKKHTTKMTGKVYEKRVK